MKYFNTKQTASLLGYNDDSYIRKLIADGRLKAEKFGREWKVSEETISDYRTKSEIASSCKALIAFNTELRLLANECMNERREIGPKDSLTNFVITKAHKTHGAILLLCKEGYGEDASVLSRTLFELLVTLFYVLEDPTDERVYRYFAYDWVLRMKMLRSNKNHPEIWRQLQLREAKPKKWDTTLAQVEKNYKLVMEKYNYKGNSWSDKSVADMAEEIGRDQQYRTIYKLHSQQVHSQPRIANDYASMSEGGLLYSSSISDNMVELNLVTAFDFFGSIIDKANDHFGLGIEKRLKDLVERYLQAMKKMQEESD